MANLSKIKREQLLSKIENLKKNLKDPNDIESLNTINEIQKEIQNKKYGLVWEEHSEKVDEMLVDNIPVFTEDKSKQIVSDPNLLYNFLIEGDNLHALKLLEKTHKGKIDVIYIDPPYNTGNKDFMYDDNYVDKDDKYRHSKWASFLYERIKIAKTLLSKNGTMFISIDDNEHHVLKQICDSIFSENLFLTTIGWEKRTKCQNTKTAKFMLQPKIEYILVYKNSTRRKEFNCHVIGKKDYPLNDEKGEYRIEEIGQMSYSGIRGRNSMIFPILGIDPNEGNQWKLGKDTIDYLLGRGDIFLKNNKVFRKVRPYDESVEKIKPFWAFFSAEQYGTAESAKTYLGKILNKKDHGFETVKPVEMIKELLFQSTSKSSIILDFFAGSGTTAESVEELNFEDGGNRKFILCTNNDGGICSDVTYPRISTIIKGLRPDKTKFSNGIPANLKYYKTDFIPKNSNQNQSVSSTTTINPISGASEVTLCDKLQDHISELVQLETHHNIDDEYYKMVLDDTVLSNLITNINKYPNLKEIYISSTILLDSNQKQILLSKNIKVSEIPNYYFSNELKENGELW